MKKFVLAAMLSGVCAAVMAEPWDVTYFEPVVKMVGTAKSVAYLPPLGNVKIERSRVTTMEGKTYTTYGAFPGVEGTALSVERRRNNGQIYLCGGTPRSCLNLTD